MSLAISSRLRKLVSGPTMFGVSLGILTWLTLELVLVLQDVVLARPSTTSQQVIFNNIRQAEFVKSLDTYEISIPHRVTEQGEFLSHDVPHSLVRAPRQRREAIATENIHYRIPVGDQDYHVELRPNHKLLSPGFVIETHHGQNTHNLSGVSIERPDRTLCHFVGEVKDQTESSVAVATCDGLHGYLRVGQEEYFIEPVQDHEIAEEGHHPHVVYKRSALLPEHDILRAQGCGVEGTGKDEEETRKNWEKSERRKRDVSEDEDAGYRRYKRSISIERNVETLVVVDPVMVKYYKDENIRTYVLTIMNMVTNLYHQSSIGNAVNIVLVRLLFLKVAEENLTITHHADNTLDSFCQWQKMMNTPDDNDPHHHDVAILLTRHNICSRMNAPCSTLGLSQVSGMCQPHRSCNINEDTGLALAFTVSHELGHNFGMQHDGPQNNCEARPGEVQHVMAPQLNAEASPLVWSSCSRDAITRFLDRGWGFCLNDQPGDHDFKFSDVPPGVMYDVNHQCRLQYGPKAQFCEGIDDICTTLWCQVDNKCLTRMEAAAAGTLCGGTRKMVNDQRWCHRGKCETIIEQAEVIHGEWGQWGSWSECSRTCGAGVTHRARHCDNPPPTNGGRYCLGERRRYTICEIDPCPENVPSFRHQQCAEFNTIIYKNDKHEWEPVTQSPNPCQLHCKPKDEYFSVMLKDVATDGTPCRPGARDMCIGGVCKRVGCDWEIDSKAQEDHCGVCHGDGSTCKTVKDEFTEEIGNGYVEAMVIPPGARNIRVEEVAEASNYLAVRNDKGVYYLNGNWFIQWSGEYDVGGTTIQYTRTGFKETMMSPGPLKEQLHIMLLFQSENPGVTFEYTIPNENATDQRPREYHWKYLDWTHCTVSCGGGFQRSEVICVEKDGGHVDDFYCNISTKPDDMQQDCNSHLCPARWWMGPWQHCSVTCGQNGIHLRTVLCVRRLGTDEQMALDDYECEDLPKPSEREPCHHKDPCPNDAFWEASSTWSDSCTADLCSVQTRKVKCSSPLGNCDPKTKPRTERQCNNVTCGEWTTSEWSQCTRTCGGGVHQRQVACVGAPRCRADTEPPSQGSCETKSCDLNHRHHKPTGDRDHNMVLKDIVDTMLRDEPQSEATNEPKQKPEEAVSTDSITHTEADENEPTVNVVEPISVSESRPEETAENTKKSLNHRWIPLFWSECSKPCGSGVKTRNLMCINTEVLDEVDFSQCDGLPKPQLNQPCNSAPCQQKWKVQPWGKCNGICESGLQEREITCPTVDQCDIDRQPPKQRPCPLVPCNTWQTSDWSKCSVSCGSGAQHRTVSCLNATTKQPADNCPPDRRPADQQQCNTEKCRGKSAAQESRPVCKGDQLSFNICKHLRKKGKCQQAVVQRKCCQTCIRAGSRDQVKPGATS